MITAAARRLRYIFLSFRNKRAPAPWHEFKKSTMSVNAQNFLMQHFLYKGRIAHILKAREHLTLEKSWVPESELFQAVDQRK